MTDVQVAQNSTSSGPVPVPGGPLSYLHWGPGIAGAVVAAATSFVLMGFASAVGLMVVSPSPTWRDTSVWLAILSGFWIVVVAVGSFALGGYLAGRVRSTWSASEDEVEFRDGAHGLIVWAIGVILGAVLIAISAHTIAGGIVTSSPRDTAGAPSFLAFELDRLFRPDTAGPELRAEAGRIIMRGIGRTELPAEDRAQLVRITSSASLSAPDAERRVTQVLTDARTAASQARKASVILGFCLAAGLAAAAAAAWVAAGIGGKHRDEEFSPPMRFGRAGVRRI